MAFPSGNVTARPYSWSVLSINIPGHPSQQRLALRIQELAGFHSSNGRMPSVKAADHTERSLALFAAVLKQRSDAGHLCPELTDLLSGISYFTPEAPCTGRTRHETFMEWLARIEDFVRDNGFRPGCSHENDLYQWIVRARRRLDNGHLDEITARRLTTVLSAPDRRQYRARLRDTEAA